jgi:hypothetical protein
MVRGGRRRLLRHPARAHALPDRLRLDDGEDKVAGNSGRFLSRARRSWSWPTAATGSRPRPRPPSARIENTTYDLAALWPSLVKSVGAASRPSSRPWSAISCGAAAGRGSGRGTGRGGRLGRGGPRGQGAVRDRADQGRLRGRGSGPRGHRAPHQARQTERELALALEWEMRTGGADALAFGVACLPAQTRPAARLAVEREVTSGRSCSSTSGRWWTATAAT